VTFKEVLAQVIDWLQQDKRLSYRALQRQFVLDNDYLDDLKAELIEVRRVAVDEDGRVLVWTGDTSPASAIPTAPTMPGAPGPLTYTPSHLAEKILTSRSALEGERKQVTVLLADLKGSMELLADRDPEEARQLLDPVLERMMVAVHRYEGTVNQVMGDGIMALFGAPIAHEDHAVRACYAALAMHAAIRAYAEEVRRTQGLIVQIRVGLNAGEVVVRAISNDLHMDYTAVGQTTHLAARMEQLASPGSTLLTADTLRLVEGLVQVTALGPIPVKGLPEPVEVFELTGASALRRRFQAAAARGLTPFVGRQQELDSVYQALERTRTGQGQVVALVGDAGVGKSRLVHECLHSHRTQGWRVLEIASVSYGKATPYFPVIDLLKRYCHVDDGDDARTIRAKVTGQVLTLDETLQEALPALLALLDAAPEDSPFLRLDPTQRRQRTLDGLKRVLLRESQVQPLLLVFEDLHWIDSETQAVLDRLVESLPTRPLLLLVNYRPEYQHSWGNKTYYTQLRLDPLLPASADAFLQALLGDDPSLESLAPLLIARTQGNPFFLEESVRTLVETGVLVGTPGAYRLVKPFDSLQVPATVQAVLAARIDRLPPEEKQLLQTAAVIGTEVPSTLLQAIAEAPEESLRLGLSHLQAAEFLYETRLFPDIAYTFKHALTQQVAYETLLQERRRALHARIVEALETLAGDRSAEQGEQLANHAFRGEVWDKAQRYLRQVGTRAMRQAAYRQAVAYHEHALVALRHLPQTRETMDQGVDLHFDLRAAWSAIGELQRVPEVLQAAAALAEALGDPGRQGRVALYMALHFNHVGAYDHCIAASERALALATTSGDVGGRVQAHNYLGIAFHALGDYSRAMAVLRQARAALTGEQCYERFGQVSLPAVLTRTLLGLCLADVGAFSEGITIGTESRRLAEAVDHPVDRMGASYTLGLPYLYKGQLSAALPLLERALEISHEVLPLYFPIIASHVGQAYVASGRGDDALALLERAVTQLTAMGMTWFLARVVTYLSEAALVTGRLEEATAHARRALELSRNHKERGTEAWVLRCLGDIALHGDPPQTDQATIHYQQALTLAEALGMRPLQAHCHYGLGRLYGQTGQRQQAHTELSTAITMYRALDMTFWLPQAEAALAQMEGR
jgi:class 3 adenylate cyclase/tetratricopeptide (TPR) repeat protein